MTWNMTSRLNSKLETSNHVVPSYRNSKTSPLLVRSLGVGDRYELYLIVHIILSTHENLKIIHKITFVKQMNTHGCVRDLTFYW